MPSLHILKGPSEGAVVPLKGDRVILGRNPDCNLVIPISSISRIHARIMRDGAEYFIEDNQSRNGTFVNNQLVKTRTRLKNNDRIRLCDFIAAFLDGTTIIEDPQSAEIEDEFPWTTVLSTTSPSMTEAEWLTSTDVEGMLDFLGGQVSPRKLRLFACACCRRVWNLIPSPPARAAVEASERFADGRASERELRDVAHGRWAPLVEVAGANSWQALHALQAAACASRVDRASLLRAPGYSQSARPDLEGQANLLRDILGNPWRAAAVDPAWLAWEGGTVRKLAQAIYDDGAFGDLPVLADALEEAGAAEKQILDHLRKPGLHARGCWVVDALLANE